MKKIKLLQLLVLMIYSVSVYSQTDTLKGEFHNGLAIVNYGGKLIRDSQIQGGKFGFINKNNEVIIPAIYDYVSDFESGYAIVNIGLTFSVMDSNKIEKRGLCGIIDSTGKIVVPILYDFIDRLEHLTNYGKRETRSNKTIMAAKNQKIGWIDFNGQVKIPFIYDDGKHEYTGNLFRVKKGTKWGYVDINGNEIIPFIYDKVGIFKDGQHARCIKDGVEILIDLPIDLIKSKSGDNGSNVAPNVQF
jgi:hypothetical protein